MYAEDVVIFFTQLILFTLAEAAAAPLGLNVIIVASQGKGTEARAQEFRSYLLSTHADRHVVDISFTVCFFCVSAGILVTDILGVGWRTAMKFYRLVDLGVRQIISPFGELRSRG